MVDRHQRLGVDQRDRLRGGEADDDAADQPGPGRRRDPVDRVDREVGVRQRPRDDAVERLDMGARGDLRHHAAERRVLGDLRQHHVGQDLARPEVPPGPAALDHRGGGLVACGLDSEYKHGSTASIVRSRGAILRHNPCGSARAAARWR